MRYLTIGFILLNAIDLRQALCFLTDTDIVEGHPIGSRIFEQYGITGLVVLKFISVMVVLGICWVINKYRSKRYTSLILITFNLILLVVCSYTGYIMSVYDLPKEIEILNADLARQAMFERREGNLDAARKLLAEIKY